MIKKAAILIFSLSLLIGVLVKQAGSVHALTPAVSLPITPVLPVTPVLPITPVGTFSLSGKVKLLPSIIIKKGFRRPISTPQPTTIRVEVKNTITKQTTLITIDSSGHFLLNLAPGKYTVQVQKVKGYIFFPKKQIVNLIQNRVGVNFLGSPKP